MRSVVWAAVAAHHATLHAPNPAPERNSKKPWISYYSDTFMDEMVIYSKGILGYGF
ncbi:hypothetical protein KDK_17360 [Dictyobacter kobayashii]|uniref:Uncharacterized protein n=1 Tax=Dictyobacter kobayashii TaxID=2014872 RepID=A0A402AFS4_9CHLR|nr:hypothetical protein KDK_17360 [Dictyobacter kobayashii]